MALAAGMPREDPASIWEVIAVPLTAAMCRTDFQSVPPDLIDGLEVRRTLRRES